MPSGIGVEKGEKVKPTPKNLVPGADNKHGFTIPAYNITEVVTRDEPKTVTFVADKAGVYPYSCQLHPAHIGGCVLHGTPTRGWSGCGARPSHASPHANASA